MGDGDKLSVFQADLQILIPVIHQLLEAEQDDDEKKEHHPGNPNTDFNQLVIVDHLVSARTAQYTDRQQEGIKKSVFSFHRAHQSVHERFLHEAKRIR